MTLLHLPHHDGSALHLEQRVPAVGETLEVRVRVPWTYPATAVHLRSMRDGEPSWVEAKPDREDPHDRWWVADLLVGNPVVNYRFLLDRGADGYSWLNGTGVHDREVSDAFDFRVTIHRRAPAWTADAIIYQVFPDRFARSEQVDGPLPAWAVPAAWHEPVVERGPDTPRQLYGGDLRGIEAHLDHVASLGATVLYLCPFFPAASNHRYDAASFDRVDPLLGGDDALVSLVTAAHARGIRVIGDLTTNHTGATHDWFRQALADPDSPEAGFYLFATYPDDYECWLGERSLPKLDLRSPDLRARLVEGPDSTVARYLREPFGLDGWRIDVANMTGRAGSVDVNAEVAAAIRATMAAVDEDSYLLAEHFHDPADDLRRDGWHGVMNYLGFLRPLWLWLHDGRHPLPFLGMPVDVASTGAEEAVETMREVSAQLPWSAFTASATLLGSHDTPRARTVFGSRDRQLLGAAILATYPGVPMLFMGDELGLTGTDGEDARTPMPWDEPDRTDVDLLAVYRELLALRRAHPALSGGGLRWVEARPELLAYLRESDAERLLIVGVRDGTEMLEIPATLVGDAQLLHGEADVSMDDGTLQVSITGPAWAVVSLDGRDVGGRS